MEWERIIEQLKSKDIAFSQNESVASRSTFKIGGGVRLAVFPSDREQLVGALIAIRDSGLRYEIIGNASNLLFAFDSFDGVMVFTSSCNATSVDGDRIYADCGTSITGLARLAADASLSGLEFAYGIPGLVGGSVYMNAGAYGSQISAVLEYSDVFDMKSGEIIRIREHGFGYRDSIYMREPGLVCLGACFDLTRGNAEAIRAAMAENMASRRDKQPLEFPSAGSYFKRPEGHFAGKLIEDCSLKGMRIGGAEVSEKHAGFIINRGGATATDVLTLEEKIKEIVMSRFGIELEREVRLIK